MSVYTFTEERPWGGFLILQDTDTYKVKQLVIKPGHRLSYQMHYKRAEHWYIVQGVATVTIDDIDREVKTGESVDIDVEMKHRVANNGEEDVILIEVQTGTYFGEDDIVRFSDDYGRASA